MNLSHHFLIAMPEMGDPIFTGTVTYILQHDEEGAMGVIINRSIKLTMEDVFKSAEVVDFKKDVAAQTACQGGPVAAEQGFILHRPSERNWAGTLSNDHLMLTTSKDLLEAIALGEDPADYLFCLGYCGWSAGQLEEELKSNAWLTVEADSHIIFSTPLQKRYQEALASLGVDLSNLSGHGGRA